MPSSTPEEFPRLPALGLYAADIRGDGNCLFNALSDQIYGDQHAHADIRARVVSHLREHADTFKKFLNVQPGGGLRRNPKRKNAGTYSSSRTYLVPTPEDVDRTFENHLMHMAREGTYGDHMEITAFAAAFQTDVMIYQRGEELPVFAGQQDSANPRPVAHIAYHRWEHYSSIRNLDGPHTGLPLVKVKKLSSDEEAELSAKLAHSSPVMPWQIDAVHNALPYTTDRFVIRRALEDKKGDIDAAMSVLLDAAENGSISSQQENSSIERGQESDDELDTAPRKKQQRPIRGVIYHMSPRLQCEIDATPNHSDDSSDSDVSSRHEGSQQSVATRPTSVEEDGIEKRKDHDWPPAAERKPILLKLHPPRPPKTQSTSSQAPKRSTTHLRISAKDKKSMQKQAQQAARKQRQEAIADSPAGEHASRIESGLALRNKGMTETPPAENLRVLFI